MVRLIKISLLAAVLLLLFVGIANANMGPGVGIILFSIILGVPALILLIVWLAVPNETIRAIAKVLLLVIAVLAVLATVQTIKLWDWNETWQWHGAKNTMETVQSLLVKYSADSDPHRYPVGELDEKGMFDLLNPYFEPTGQTTTGLPVYIDNLHYGSADGKTYRMEADVYIRSGLSWIWATPEEIGPEEPGPRPSGEDLPRWHTIKRTSKRDADGVKRTVHIRYWGPPPLGDQLPSGVDISQYQVEFDTKLPPKEVYNKKLKKYQLLTNRYGSKMEGPFIGPGPDGKWFTEDDVRR